MAGLDVRIANGVQWITFNRPEKKNAINNEMYEALISRLRQSSDDDLVAVTVLTGAGDYYSSGNDFSGQGDADLDLEQRVDKACSLFQEWVAAIIDYPKLLVAIVNGPAIGIAATTLALFDVVYASTQAWLYTPFTHLGLVPEGCSTLIFPQLLGYARASRLLYLNEKLSAQEAFTCGLVSRVCPPEELREKAAADVQAFAKLPSESLKLSKKLVRDWDREYLHQVNREEGKVLRERFKSEEFFSALLSFSTRKSKL